jgi:hypothetical protein
MIDWAALAQVAIAGLVLGAGIPGLFALGTRLLSPTTGADGVQVPVTVVRRLGAYTCFGICCAAVIAGVFFLAAGGHS